jgi:DNA-binding beta-propeller fold protein YncE
MKIFARLLLAIVLLGWAVAAAPALAQATITSFSPISGPEAGYNTVVINGSGFTGATGAMFGGAGVVRSFAVNSDTQITVTAPPYLPGGPVFIIVQVPTGGAVSKTEYTYLPPPVVNSVSPNFGPIAGGNGVTLNGVGFTGATSVTFGGKAAPSFAVGSDTQITLTAPADAESTVPVQVITPAGTSAASVSAQYSFIIPGVTSLDPPYGLTSGGNTVTVNGAHFTGASQVWFGSTVGSNVNVINDSQLTVVAPSGAALGPATIVDIEVQTPDGRSPAVDADRYDYVDASTTTLTSSANPSSFAQPVTLTANVTGFGPAPAGTLTIADGTTTLWSGALVAIPTIFTTSGLAVGNHSITAAYSGDQYYAPSASTALVQVVNPVAAPVAGQTYSYQRTLGVTGTAGTDNAHFHGPVPTLVDQASGRLFVADTLNHRVQVLDSSALTVLATIGVSGVSGSDNAHLNQPGGVAFDATVDHLYVADTGNDRIQVFDATSFAYLATIGVNGVAGTDNVHFNQPTSVQVNASNHQLYIADSGNHRVQIFDAPSIGYVGTIGASGVTGTDNGHFNLPRDAELNPSVGQIMVADSGNSRVQLFDAKTFNYAGTIGGSGLSPALNTYVGTPVTAAFDPGTNLVLVADAGGDDRVEVFDALSYNYVLTIGTTGTSGTGNGQFSAPGGIAADLAHQHVFIGDPGNNRIQVYSIAPAVNFASLLPGSRSVQVGNPATVFASMINAGTNALNGCQLALPVNAPAGLTLGYQTTNPSTNALIGTPNTPATIAGNDGIQTFLVTLQGTAAFSAPGMPLDFDCSGVAPAAIVTGVDTVDLVMSSTPVADIIALAATATNNGIISVPNGGAGAFAVASSNVGATAAIIVSVDTGTASLPVTPTICQSNPSTGQCLATPGSTVSLTDAAGATPTFSVFLQATGAIAFNPGASRIFVRFKDASGGLHGSTSVAIETQ